MASKQTQGKCKHWDEEGTCMFAWFRNVYLYNEIDPRIQAEPILLLRLTNLAWYDRP